jgi:hypothetical protein
MKNDNRLFGWAIYSVHAEIKYTLNRVDDLKIGSRIRERDLLAFLETMRIFHHEALEDPHYMANCYDANF